MKKFLVSALLVAVVLAVALPFATAGVVWGKAHVAADEVQVSHKGRTAIQRATHDEGLPCLIVDYEDTERVIGVAGPEDFREEVESKAVDGRSARIDGPLDRSLPLDTALAALIR